MYHPHTHMTIAHERQADLLREARKHELASHALAASERTSMVGRVFAFLRLRRVGATKPALHGAR
ncbi:MAG: hypothetical protein ACRDON_02850 [Gaiellaceae bacterium]